MSIMFIFFLNFQDPREALILSLKREVNVLQNENEHLRSALMVYSKAPGSAYSDEMDTGKKKLYLIKPLVSIKFYITSYSILFD